MRGDNLIAKFLHTYVTFTNEQDYVTHHNAFESQSFDQEIQKLGVPTTSTLVNPAQENLKLESLTRLSPIYQQMH
jgi:hypothetical protein